MLRLGQELAYLETHKISHTGAPFIRCPRLDRGNRSMKNVVKLEMPQSGANEPSFAVRHDYNHVADCTRRSTTC